MDRVSGKKERLLVWGLKINQTSWNIVQRDLKIKDEKGGGRGEGGGEGVRGGGEGVRWGEVSSWHRGIANVTQFLLPKCFHAICAGFAARQKYLAGV